MVLNKAGKDIPECYANQYGVFENETVISMPTKKRVARSNQSCRAKARSWAVSVKPLKKQG